MIHSDDQCRSFGSHLQTSNQIRGSGHSSSEDSFNVQKITETSPVSILPSLIHEVASNDQDNCMPTYQHHENESVTAAGIELPFEIHTHRVLEVEDLDAVADGDEAPLDVVAKEEDKK